MLGGNPEIMWNGTSTAQVPEPHVSHSNASSSSDQFLQQTPAVEAVGTNPMWAAMLSQDAVHHGSSSNVSSSSAQVSTNPMWGAMFGKNVSSLDSSTWRRVPRRRDVAEGDSVEGVRPTGHPLDDLADAGKLEDGDSEAGEEDSLSEESGDEEHSDDDDVFTMTTASADHLSSAYQNFWLYRWGLAERELCQELRDEVLLPLDPSDARGTCVYSDIEEAVVLPPWHCFFAGCGASERQLNAGDKHEYNLWRHVWQQTALNTSHAPLLNCLLYTSPSPRDQRGSRMPSSA